ncbi:MAG: hypothetical protein HKP61_23195 [Dactylosporangium sp.]|nr:hypothetical protein [Dactylosporangium sp.]NNJ63786.1 hypothetical protein [Dactylosporangium sp.]
MLSIVAGMGAFTSRALKVLAASGIQDPQAGQWYSQQAWLDAFQKLGEQLGPNTLIMIGKTIPENAKFPPNINSIETALASIDKAYHMNHRGGEIGSYKVVSSQPKSARMVCENPYPCDFDRGIVLGTATKYKPATSGAVRVSHDDTQPCRKKGARSCTYQIDW